jgi:hypothetical protein
MSYANITVSTTSGPQTSVDPCPCCTSTPTVISQCGCCYSSDSVILWPGANAWIPDPLAAAENPGAAALYTAGMAFIGSPQTLRFTFDSSGHNCWAVLGTPIALLPDYGRDGYARLSLVANCDTEDGQTLWRFYSVWDYALTLGEFNPHPPGPVLLNNVDLMMSLIYSATPPDGYPGPTDLLGGCCAWPAGYLNATLVNEFNNWCSIVRDTLNLIPGPDAGAPINLRISNNHACRNGDGSCSLTDVDSCAEEGDGSCI